MGMKKMTEDERKEIRSAFREAVNMGPQQLERWLDTDASRSVGWTHQGEDASVGYQSGRRIVRLKRKAVSELSDDDYAHMRKVIGYVRRHSAQRPDGDAADTNWRYSLMNWGHDPLKSTGRA
jgi:Protein of unknown function (DUF3140)